MHDNVQHPEAAPWSAATLEQLENWIYRTDDPHESKWDLICADHYRIYSEYLASENTLLIGLPWDDRLTCILLIRESILNPQEP